MVLCFCPLWSLWELEFHDSSQPVHCTLVGQVSRAHQARSSFIRRARREIHKYSVFLLRSLEHCSSPSLSSPTLFWITGLSDIWCAVLYSLNTIKWITCTQKVTGTILLLLAFNDDFIFRGRLFSLHYELIYFNWFLKTLAFLYFLVFSQHDWMKNHFVPKHWAGKMALFLSCEIMFGVGIMGL